VLIVVLVVDFVVAAGKDETVAVVAVVVVVAKAQSADRSSTVHREVVASSHIDLEQSSAPVFESLAPSTLLFGSQVVGCLSEVPRRRLCVCLISCWS